MKAVPIYKDLLRMQTDEPESFAQLARKCNAEVEEEDTRKEYLHRHQIAGKILCAARAALEKLKQEPKSPWGRISLPRYFQSKYGCPPSCHAYPCEKTYRVMVLTGMIAEADYDEHVSAAIEVTAEIIKRVNEEVSHVALAEVASILRQRRPSTSKYLSAILDRLIDDPASDQVKLLTKEEADEHKVPDLDYASATAFALRIAKQGRHSVLAEPLKEMAESTPNSDDARALAVVAAQIQESLKNNCDERGNRRFSDEQISSWMNLGRAPVKITKESMIADYLAKSEETQEIGERLKQAGIPLPAQTFSANPSCKLPQSRICLKRWRGAEQVVIELLNAKGFTVEDVSRQKLGYDIEARTADGEEQFIEVKSISSPGEPFSLTDRELAVARNKGPAYQLALVHQAESALEIAFIPNPSEALQFVQQVKQLAHQCSNYPFNPEYYRME